MKSNVKLRITNCKKYTPTRTYRLAIKPSSIPKKELISFQLNDYVKNIDGLSGIIQSKDDSQVIVKWQDNTIERIRNDILDTGYLVKLSEEPKVNETVKKVKSLEKKLADKDLLKDKNLNINELVDLAITKGMVEPDDKDMEILRVQSMSDNEFLLYQESVLNAEMINGEVSLLPESVDDYSGLSPKEREAHQELDKLKRMGRYTPQTYQNHLSSTSRSRSLADIRAKSGINDYHNIQMPVKFEDSFFQKFNGIFNQLPGQNQKMQQAAAVNNQFVNNIEHQQIDETFINELANSQSNDQLNNQSNVQNNSIDDDWYNFEQSYNQPVQKVASSSNQDNLSLDTIINKIHDSDNDKTRMASSAFLNAPFIGITKPLSMGSEDDPCIQTPANTTMSNLFKNLDWTTPQSRATRR